MYYHCSKSTNQAVKEVFFFVKKKKKTGKSSYQPFKLLVFLGNKIACQEKKILKLIARKFLRVKKYSSNNNNNRITKFPTMFSLKHFSLFAGRLEEMMGNPKGLSNNCSSALALFTATGVDLTLLLLLLHKTKSNNLFTGQRNET